MVTVYQGRAATRRFAHLTASSLSCLLELNIGPAHLKPRNPYSIPAGIFAGLESTGDIAT